MPDDHSKTNKTQIEVVLHDFIRDAVSHLRDALNDSVPEFEDEATWKLDTDGHYREHKKRVRRLWRILNDEWLSLRPNYKACVEHLKADPIIASHLDRLVGTVRSCHRLGPNNILNNLIYAMLDDEGQLTFNEEKLQSEWRDLATFFRADKIVFKTVAPLPYLALPKFPLRLNAQTILDRLTDEELSRCCQVGVLRPISTNYPLIYGEIPVGIRRTILLAKLIQQGNESLESPDIEGEGNFGSRPSFREDLIIDDVLSALRLFKRTQIRAAGRASWTDSFWLDTTTSYQSLGHWPYGGKFELSEEEVPQFLHLWHLLEQGSNRFTFSIHRFNLAFDRGLLADRIVDLVIAAEALFLSDMGAKDRGEIRFRFALRAAKFIQHPSYGEQELFQIMRQAYDARSAIVHGGSPDKLHLPDNQSADLPVFIDTVEELVRLGIRKALSMKEDGVKMRQASYWDTLVFSKPIVRA